MLRVTVNLDEQGEKALSLILERLVSKNKNQGVRYALIETAKNFLPQNTNILVNQETQQPKETA